MASSQRRPWPRLAGLMVAVAVLAAGGLGAWRTWWPPENPRSQYQLATVQRGDIEDLVTATGTLQPRDYVDVGAQVSGQLRKIHVEVGSIVQQGDLLAEIDPTVLLANVDASRAGLRNLQANLLVREAALALAQDQHARQTNLMAAEATTIEALRTAENNLRSALALLAAQKASIEQTQSTLRANEANLNYARIYAPISGAVVTVSARQGQTLNANQSAPIVLRVADLATMTVQTLVSEADVGRLRVGMPVYFTTLGSQGQRWTSRLRKIEPTPTVTNNVVLYNALFDVPNADQRLMTSMTAQVFFIAAQARDALLVPAAAVQLLPRAARGQGAAGERSSAATTAPATSNSPAPPPPSPPAQGAGTDRMASVRGPDQAAAPVQRGLFMGPAGAPPSPPRQAMVRVMDAAGQLQERRVQVGISNRVQVQVLSGLAEGEDVVLGQRLPAGSASAARANPVRSAGPAGASPWATPPVGR